jgi:hypothetical protein
MNMDFVEVALTMPLVGRNNDDLAGHEAFVESFQTSDFLPQPFFNEL